MNQLYYPESEELDEDIKDEKELSSDGNEHLCDVQHFSLTAVPFSMCVVY